MKIIINKKQPEKVALILLTIAVFVLPIYLRYAFLGSLVGRINILGAIAALFLTQARLRLGWKIGTYALMACLMTFTQIINPASSKFLILSILNFMVPILIIIVYSDRTVNSYNVEFNIKLIKKILKIFNICVYILTICAIIDRLSSNTIAKFIANLSGDSVMISMARTGKRLVSAYGHPLIAAEIFLIFYVLNYVFYKQIKNEKFPIRFFAISLIGELCAVSKGGITYLLIIFLITNVKKISYLIGGFLVLAVAYFSGIFDAIFTRFTTTTLTTGRFEAWIYMQKYDINYFPLVIGHGIYYVYTILNNIYYNASAAFEFLPLMFSTEYGVLFTVLMYILIFIAPLLQIWKNSGVLLTIICLIVMVQINTYTALGNYADEMFMYAWFIYLFRMMIATGIQMKKHG